MKINAINAGLLAAFAASTALAGDFIPYPSKYTTAIDACTADQTGKSSTGAAIAGVTKATADAAMPLYCRPELTFYIVGASAPNSAVVLEVPRIVFDQSKPIFKIEPTTDSAIYAADRNSKAIGWYGYGSAESQYAGKRIYVGYNSMSGSAAGVAQLISKTSPEPEAEMIFPGDLGGCVVQNSGASVVADPGKSIGFTASYKCKNTKALEAHMAFSDVHPWELDQAYMRLQNGGKSPKLSALTLVKSTPIAVQGFGVVASEALYKALQRRDIRLGRIASNCEGKIAASAATADSAELACRPNISSADYASLVSIGGNTTSVEKWLGDASEAGKTVTVVRRISSSGTQAASNIYFLRNVCQGLGENFAGTTSDTVLSNANVNVDGAPVKISFGGAMKPLPAGSFGSVTVDPKGQTDDVRNALKTDTTNYLIGVVSLDGDESKLGKGRFVRLDGADPVATWDGTGLKFDVTQRTNLINGRWPFAFELQAVFKGTVAKEPKLDSIRTDVITGMQKSSASLTGLGYIKEFNNVATSDKVALVKRAGGNNCAPLVRIN